MHAPAHSTVNTILFLFFKVPQVLVLVLIVLLAAPPCFEDLLSFFLLFLSPCLLSSGSTLLPV